jgi:polysaccharide biosynthesis/export protein
VLRSLLVVSSLVAAGALGCSHAPPRYDYASEPDPRKQEYVLGPSDLLHITVWHNPDLTGDALIRPDGTISLPLIGDVRAAGRTPEQLRAEIVQMLTTFIKDQSAAVTVTVSGVNSYRFVVLGNVEHGGAFSSNRYVTVSEAISLAGGPNRFANPEEAVIIRNDATKGRRRIPIDYSSILKGTHPEHDLALMTGDTIYVP